jgi:hypothetical protein
MSVEFCVLCATSSPPKRQYNRYYQITTTTTRCGCGEKSVTDPWSYCGALEGAQGPLSSTAMTSRNKSSGAQRKQACIEIQSGLTHITTHHNTHNPFYRALNGSVQDWVFLDTLSAAALPTLPAHSAEGRCANIKMTLRPISTQKFSSFSHHNSICISFVGSIRHGTSGRRARNPMNGGSVHAGACFYCRWFVEVVAPLLAQQP